MTAAVSIFNLFLILAFGPLIWSIVYAERCDGAPWPLKVQRLFIAVLVLLAVSATAIYAAEVRNPIPDGCAALSGWEWFLYCIL